MVADEDTLVGTVLSTTISTTTSAAAVDADRDLHLHLSCGIICDRSRLSWLRGAAR
jgi:CO dehydrogenase nickel-insertion accessory protein CooC1